MMHTLIRYSGIPDRDRIQDSTREDTRFADAVTDEGYTTALSRPTLAPNFAGTETHSSHQGDEAATAVGAPNVGWNPNSFSPKLIPLEPGARRFPSTCDDGAGNLAKT
jgi:hypothetical protein